jgi:hypothetical protein
VCETHRGHDGRKKIRNGDKDTNGESWFIAVIVEWEYRLLHE